MKAEKHCSECGVKMDSDALSGLCPRCMLAYGQKTQPNHKTLVVQHQTTILDRDLSRLPPPAS